MSDRRKITWEYWQNPYGGYGPEFVKEEDAETPETPWEQNEKGYDSKDVEVRPVLPTPMGLMPIQSFRNFPDVFEFWIGHTNFDVDDDISELIEFSPGVETYDLFSRYRFRIGVGKAFKGGEVKYQIQKTLNALPPQKGEINPNSMRLDEDTKDKVSLLQNLVKDKFKYWAIYVMPNGEIDVAGSNTEEGYKMHMELYSSALEMAGGVIYNYA